MSDEINSNEETLNTEAEVVADGEERREFVFSDFDISSEEIQRIAHIGKFIVPEMSSIIEDFYSWLRTKSYFEDFFPDHDQIVITARKQERYWERFFAGHVDESFIESRMRVAEVHAKVGLPPEYHLSATQFMYEQFVEKILANKETSQSPVEYLNTLAKFIHFDTAIVVNAFSTEYSQREILQSKAAWEMSAPVTKVWDSILMLPLSGYIDSQRALDVSSRILEAISTSQSQIFILDIGGVAVVDTAVANYLVKITKTTHLMGCESVISGISPDIAQSIVNLGIDVGTIKTTTTLKDALRYAYGRIGVTISE